MGWDDYHADNPLLSGDGTVVAWSAVLGDRYADKTFGARAVTHGDLVKNTDVLLFIHSIIDNGFAIPNETVIASEVFEED